MPIPGLPFQLNFLKRMNAITKKFSNHTLYSTHYFSIIKSYSCTNAGFSGESVKRMTAFFRSQ